MRDLKHLLIELAVLAVMLVSIVYTEVALRFPVLR